VACGRRASSQEARKPSVLFFRPSISLSASADYGVAAGVPFIIFSVPLGLGARKGQGNPLRSRTLFERSWVAPCLPASQWPPERLRRLPAIADVVRAV